MLEAEVYVYAIILCQVEKRNENQIEIFTSIRSIFCSGIFYSLTVSSGESRPRINLWELNQFLVLSLSNSHNLGPLKAKPVISLVSHHPPSSISSIIDAAHLGKISLRDALSPLLKDFVFLSFVKTVHHYATYTRFRRRTLNRLWC